jgi:hypothetical protein
MYQPELYQAYSRDKALALLAPPEMLTVFSSGDLMVSAEAGFLFAVFGHPPHQSYFLTDRLLRWFSTETELDFYNIQMLSFRSRYRPGGLPLYLFGKLPTGSDYTYLGSLQVSWADGPWYAGDFQCPTQAIVQFDIEPTLAPVLWTKVNWSSTSVRVNDLPLPQALVVCITSGRWKTVPEHQAISPTVKFTSASLLTPDRMECETRLLKHLLATGLGEAYSLDDSALTGQPIEQVDRLDLTKAVCLGDTGPDEPFCLDYRVSETNPRVVYLGSGPGWEIIAPDFETFAKQLGI